MDTNAISTTFLVISKLDESFFERMKRFQPTAASKLDTLEKFHKMLKKSQSRPEINVQPNDSKSAPNRSASERAFNFSKENQ